MSHPNNIEDEKVMNAENIISYRFNGRLQLRQALQRADNIHQDGNKYLALLGDAVIKLVLVKEGLRLHATRGQISNIVPERSSNAYLAQQGFSKGLAECVFKNRSQGNTVYPGPMTDTVEAIIGAVFNDSGDNIAAAKGVMKTLNVSWPA